MALQPSLLLEVSRSLRVRGRQLRCLTDIRSIHKGEKGRRDEDRALFALASKFWHSFSVFGTWCNRPVQTGTVHSNPDVTDMHTHQKNQGDNCVQNPSAPNQPRVMNFNTEVKTGDFYNIYIATTIRNTSKPIMLPIATSIAVLCTAIDACVCFSPKRCVCCCSCQFSILKC
jgi:hypothetical protein